MYMSAAVLIRRRVKGTNINSPPGQPLRFLRQVLRAGLAEACTGFWFFVGVARITWRSVVHVCTPFDGSSRESPIPFVPEMPRSPTHPQRQKKCLPVRKGMCCAEEEIARGQASSSLPAVFFLSNLA